MRIYAMPVGQFIDQTMARLDRNHNGLIQRAAHWNDSARTERFLALADSAWTPGDPYSRRNDGYVTRHELARTIQDHVDLNHDGWVVPQERQWAQVNFGL